MQVQVARGSAAARDIPELTALRVAAALCVVVAHLHALGIVSAEQLHRILDGGRPAVTFFFVLSGFIMNHSYPHLSSGDPVAVRRYARSRFARLYPTLLLSLCIALPTVTYLAMTRARAPLLDFYALKEHYSSWLLASGAAQLLALTGWVPAAAINQPWNGPAWSLSCEFFFYALFPLLRPVLQRHSSRVLIAALLVGWLLQACWIAAIEHFVPANRAGFLAYQFPPTHLLEFIWGIGAGILMRRCNVRQLRALGLGCVGITLLAVAILHETKFQLPVSYPLTPLFTALIVAVARASGAGWLAPLRQRVVLALGHASYALYIVHVPILIGASVWGIANAVGWFWLPLLLLASLLIHYRFAEPARRYLLGRA